MRILLTGASGFVGSRVLATLGDVRRHQIAVLLRDPAAVRVRDFLDTVDVIRGSLETLAAVRAEILDFKPDAVIHLGWAGVGNRHRDDPEQLKNIVTTAELITLAKEAGASHWIGLGSQAEYGPREGSTAEDAPCHPTTLYGVAKLAAGMAAERLCADNGIRFAWLRLFSAYGPGDDAAWMLPSLILRLVAGERPSLTPGTQLWDYVYVDDAARAIAAVAATPDAIGVFNLGSGQPRTIREIVTAVRDRIDPALPLGFGEVPFRLDQVMRLEADIRRLCRATGWQPSVSLETGLDRTVDWYRNQSKTLATTAS